jgi:hypothetical protein
MGISKEEFTNILSYHNDRSMGIIKSKWTVKKTVENSFLL